MKLTPRSTARRRTLSASSGSAGSPQMPDPVMRIAPKPRRLTVVSPPSSITPLCAAITSVCPDMRFLPWLLSLCRSRYRRLLIPGRRVVHPAPRDHRGDDLHLRQLGGLTAERVAVE